MSFRAEKAELSDVPALLRLMRAYYTFEHALRDPRRGNLDFDEERQRRALTVLLGAPAVGAAYLLFSDKELAGYFVMTYGFDLEFGGRVATVTELYILEIFRRQGLGLRALGHAEKVARTGGALAVELQAERTNQAAVAFYARAGFQVHDRIPMSKRVLSTDDLRLSPIEKDGSVKGLSRAPVAGEPLFEVLALTMSLYEVAGYVPPWLCYVALAGDVPVGTCGFKSAPKDGEVELAYFTFPAFEGRGVASWMAKELLAIAADHEAAPEVFAQTLPKDGPSTTVLRNLGFIHRDTLLHPEDGLVWEWRQRKF